MWRNRFMRSFRQPSVSDSTFSPLSLSGLIAWYEAGLGETFTDVLMTTPATDGQSIEAWRDKSGNDHHSLWLGGTDRPVFDTFGADGKPAVQVAGVSVLSAVSVAMGTGTTASIFLTGRYTSSSDTYGRIVSYTGGGEANDHSNAGSFILLRNSANQELAAFRNTSPLAHSVLYDTDVRFGIIFDGTNKTTYLNNSAGSSSASAGNWTDAGALRLFGTSTSEAMAGELRCVVVTNTALGSGELALLDMYLQSR